MLLAVSVSTYTRRELHVLIAAGALLFVYCTTGRTVRSVSPTALYYVELGEKWRGFESPSALAGISRARSGTEAQSAWVPLRRPRNVYPLPLYSQFE